MYIVFLFPIQTFVGRKPLEINDDHYSVRGYFIILFIDLHVHV